MFRLIRRYFLLSTRESKSVYLFLETLLLNFSLTMAKGPTASRLTTLALDTVAIELPFSICAISSNCFCITAKATLLAEKKSFIEISSPDNLLGVPKLSPFIESLPTILVPLLFEKYIVDKEDFRLGSRCNNSRSVEIGS